MALPTHDEKAAKQAPKDRGLKRVIVRGPEIPSEQLQEFFRQIAPVWYEQKKGEKEGE